jgi:hypothetical protein
MFIAQAVQRHTGKDILGLGGSILIDLKTLRGARNRVKRYVWPANAGHVTIFDYNSPGAYACENRPLATLGHSQLQLA